MELLLQINGILYPETYERYAELIGRRQAEILTSDEYGELLNLTIQFEQLEFQRVEALAELAKLWGVSFANLMSDLEVQSASYV
ncbi:hypothetical protein NDA01_07705 [Trichocoleus desertorum AS-A10]|uniref:hypothetical protein n=1 Tax=Trichocoleus desertorum TaxID=1481672 RepID=UPI0032983374